MASTRAVSKLSVALGLVSLVLFSVPGFTLAQRPFDPGRGEVVFPAGNTGAGGGGVATIKGIEAIFENVITVALAFAGIVLFVMFLTGGFRYLTAGGDAKATEAARGTLTHAIAGLVVLVLAYIIIQFISVITGVDLRFFTIYRP